MSCFRTIILCVYIYMSDKEIWKSFTSNQKLKKEINTFWEKFATPEEKARDTQSQSQWYTQKKFLGRLDYVQNQLNSMVGQRDGNGNDVMALKDALVEHRNTHASAYANRQVPQSKNLRGGKSRGEVTLEERQAELKAAQEELAEVLADDKGTDKRIEEIDELQKQVKDLASTTLPIEEQKLQNLRSERGQSGNRDVAAQLEAVKQMQALAGLGNNNNIQPPGAAPPVVPQQQPPPAPPPSVIPQQAAQGQPGEAIDPPEMQDAEATPEMKEAEETAFGEGKVVSQAGGLIPNTTDDAPNIGIHQKAITRIFIDRNKNFTQVRDMLKGKATAQSTDELMREFRFGIRVEGLLENTQQEWDEIQALVYQYRLNVKEDEQVRQATIAGRQATATAAQGTGRPAMVVPLDMIGQEARNLILADLEGDAAMGEDEGGAAGHDGEEGEEGEGRRLQQDNNINRVRGRRLPEDNNINLDIRENDPENEVQGRQDPDAGKERGGPFKVDFKVENPTRIRNLLMPNSLLKYNPLNPRDPLPSFRKVANPEFVPMSRPSLFFRMDS